MAIQEVRRLNDKYGDDIFFYFLDIASSILVKNSGWAGKETRCTSRI